MLKPSFCFASTRAFAPPHRVPPSPSTASVVQREFPLFVETYHGLRAEGLPFSEQYQDDRPPVLDPGGGSLLDRPSAGGGQRAVPQSGGGGGGGGGPERGSGAGSKGQGGGGVPLNPADLGELSGASCCGGKAVFIFLSVRNDR